MPFGRLAMLVVLASAGIVASCSKVAPRSHAAAIAGAPDRADVGICPTGPFGSPFPDSVVVEPIAGVPPLDGFSPQGGILEGPVWVGDALYLSHFSFDPLPPSRILKVTSSGAVSVFIEHAGTNGLAISRRGELIGARHEDGSISRLSMSRPNAITPLARSYGGVRFDCPNDLTLRSDGNVYFTDPDWQSTDPPPQPKTRIYRVSPSGRVSVVDDTIDEPNGITLSPDEDRLYVSARETLYRFLVQPDGAVTDRRIWSPDVKGGDGMAVDCAGNLYVAVMQTVVVIDAQGAVLRRIQVAAEQVTNVAFGGPAHKTLYVTHLGRTPGLHKIELAIPGLPY